MQGKEGHVPSQEQIKEEMLKSSGFVIVDNASFPGLLPKEINGINETNLNGWPYNDERLVIARLYTYHKTGKIPPEIEQLGRDLKSRDTTSCSDRVVKIALDESIDLLSPDLMDEWFVCPDTHLNCINPGRREYRGFKYKVDYRMFDTGVTLVNVPDSQRENLAASGPDIAGGRWSVSPGENYYRLIPELRKALILRLVLGMQVNPSGEVPKDFTGLLDLIKNYDTWAGKKRLAFSDVSFRVITALQGLTENGFFDTLKAHIPEIDSEDFFASVTAWQVAISCDRTTYPKAGNELRLYPTFSTDLGAETPSIGAIDKEYLPFLVRGYVEYARAIEGLISHGQVFPLSEFIRQGKNLQDICQGKLLEELGGENGESLRQRDPERFLKFQEICSGVNLALADLQGLIAKYKANPGLLNRSVGVPSRGKFPSAVAFRERLRKRGARSGSKVRNVRLVGDE